MKKLLRLFFLVLTLLVISCAQKNKSSKKDEDMVYIPAGYFWMGSDERETREVMKLCKKYCLSLGDFYKAEKPKHKVLLNAYYMDKYEVTNQQYKQCVGAGKCEELPYMRTTWYGNKVYSNHPMVNVNWNQANEYCSWAGKRLPTEAEWEKAARGEHGNIWTWGNTWDENKCNNVDYKGHLTSQMAAMHNGRGTTPVGSFKHCVSPYGVYDMAGNVCEWVADWYDENYYKNSPRTNPKGPSDGHYRVMRGGSWGDFNAGDSRGALRILNGSFYRSYYSGFRCAK